MKDILLKADLHVHSKYSRRPSAWVLRKIGCSESYTEPENLYALARDRGMDLVTITDHNTLDGSLEIAHLENTFLSEEITTYFPEDRCKFHVLAYDITEKQHEDISVLRNNVFHLIKYLNEEKIIYALAHPLFAINDRLTIEHLEQAFLLFNNFEINGSRDDHQNSEPEGVTTRVINGHTFAFIGLERVGGIMVYDVTTPAAPKFVQYINTRDFSGDPESGTAGDLGPEGLIFIPDTESPGGKPLLVVACEVSGSKIIYEINSKKIPTPFKKGISCWRKFETE